MWQTQSSIRKLFHFFLLNLICYTIQIHISYAQTKPTNQQIVNAANQYNDGQYVGSCRHFVGEVLRDVGMDIGGGYKQAYLNHGYEIAASEAIPGDIMQISNDADPETYVVGYHSAIVLENKGNNSFYLKETGNIHNAIC